METETMDGARNSTLSQTALRKAAILISTLDTRAADALLAKMPHETADQVRQTVMEMEDVGAEEQNDVIREFMIVGGQIGGSFDDGVELDASLRDKIAAPGGYAEHNEHLATPARAQPFGFLRDTTSDVLARHLERQHPQVIAVVAAHLSPSQAADVIKQLLPKLQADVLRRVAELDAADEEILRDIESELESLLSDELRIARNRQTGLATVQTILNAAGADRSELLKSLSNHEGDLAAQLRHGPSEAGTDHSTTALPTRRASKPSSSERPKQQATRSQTRIPSIRTRVDENAREAITSRALHAEDAPEFAAPPREVPSEIIQIEFDDLTVLRDEDWAVLIRTAEPQVVLLALTGASEQLMKRITQRLSKNESQALRTKLHHSGPLRLSDIEHAQRHVARLASQLAAQGQIQLPARRGFAAAA
jgi:flagellar motor switch protein FliG